MLPNFELGSKKIKNGCLIWLTDCRYGFSALVVGRMGVNQGSILPTKKPEDFLEFCRDFQTSKNANS
jgi:hypothetical protein